ARSASRPPARSPSIAEAFSSGLQSNRCRRQLLEAQGGASAHDETGSRSEGRGWGELCQRWKAHIPTNCYLTVTTRIVFDRTADRTSAVENGSPPLVGSAALDHVPETIEG